ncbi:hypothetical protein GQ457_05G015620 [Hibiscus cannabinus]
MIAWIMTSYNLAKAFLEQYKHVSDMVPDRLILQHMKQKLNESFRQYAQRWRDIAAQVPPPLSEKETVVIFIQTLDGPILDRLIGNATTNFVDLVLFGELIENAVKSGKIDSGESSSHRKSSIGKKDHEVNSYGVYNVGYSKPVTISRPDLAPATAEDSKKLESNSSRQIREKLSFTQIPITYGELFPQIIKEGKLVFEAPQKSNTTKNPLPNHGGGVNVISEEDTRIIKTCLSEVESPLSWV